MQRMFDSDGFEFDRLLLLGWANRGLSDAGEVLVALEGIADGDDEAWVGAFEALGDRLSTQADASAGAGRAQSARSANLRACTYFASASQHAAGSQGADRARELWERHRACWDAAVAAFDPPVERISIPYEDTSLEGYFFHPPCEAGETDRPRPTVILNNGSDGPVSDMWAAGGAAAVERGWNGVTFDGPGQGAALYRQGLYFRSDWEAVVTPVVDFLVDRPDVDADRIALAGVSQAGYWVPRALAFEHRLVAGVADPGVVRVADSWEANLPEMMTKLLDDGNRKDFDDLMEAGLKDQPVLLAELRWRMAPYGTDSLFEAYTGARAMHLDAATLDAIECPLLITSPDHEQFWPGQSDELHGLVGDSTLMSFTEAEGASWHCEPAGRALRDERVSDWLADVFGRVG